MEAKKLDRDGNTFALIFSTGEDPVAGLTRFAEEQRIGAAYERIPVREQVEVLSLLGDIALDGDRRKIHAHVVLGRRDGAACGGHLLSARVRPTLEVIVEAAPAHLRRVHDPVSGLALIKA